MKTCKFCLESFKPNRFITHYNEDRTKQYFLPCPYCNEWIEITKREVDELKKQWLSKKNIKQLIKEADLRGELE